MAAVVACGQRLRGTYLRNRLVPAAATGNRFLSRVVGAIAGGLDGRTVPGQRGVTAPGFRAGKSPAHICPAGTGDRRLRHYCIVRRSPGGASLRSDCSIRIAGDGFARSGGGGVPAAADCADGRVISGHCSLGENGTGAILRLVVRNAGAALQRQYRGRGARLRFGRLLFAACSRHGGRDIRRRGPQRSRGAARILSGVSRAAQRECAQDTY